MRLVYIRTLLKDLLNKKVIIIISAVVFAVLFAVYGYTSASSTISPDVLEEITEYEEALDNYDLIIQEAQENIALSHDQIANLKDYCENSIYMQLDGNHIQIANAQYAITDSSNSGNTLNAWISYINDGGLKEDISATFQDIPVEYLKELISCSTSGNVLNVTVMHYDADIAKDLMKQIDKSIKAYKNTIVSVQGDFNLESLGISYYEKADTNVINNQNTNLNNLKNYQNSLADYQKKLVDGRTNRDNYIKNYTPDAYGQGTTSPTRKAIEFLIFGAIFGAVLACIFFTLRFVMSNRLKDETDIIHAGIPLIGTLNAKNEYTPQLDRCVLELQADAKNNNADSVFFDAFGSDEDYNKVVSDYKASLEQSELRVTSGNTLMESTDEAKEAIEAKNTVFIVKIGETRYEQIEDQLALCRTFGINVWGCVVIG